jgi:transcriptional regulator with XRE-family HTH domain
MAEKPHKSAFGQLLRTHRQRRRLSMSAVARAIQVSVVYYRDVERGTRRPFSRVRIDFAVLAKTLGTDADELQRAAAGERGQLELDLRGMNADMQNLAVLFANCVSRRRLAKATIEQLRQAMTRAG